MNISHFFKKDKIGKYWNHFNSNHTVNNYYVEEDGILFRNAISSISQLEINFPQNIPNQIISMIEEVDIRPDEIIHLHFSRKAYKGIICCRPVIEGNCAIANIVGFAKIVGTPYLLLVDIPLIKDKEVNLSFYNHVWNIEKEKITYLYPFPRIFRKVYKGNNEYFVIPSNMSIPHNATLIKEVKEEDEENYYITDVYREYICSIHGIKFKICTIHSVSEDDELYGECRYTAWHVDRTCPRGNRSINIDKGCVGCDFFIRQAPTPEKIIEIKQIK